MGILDQIKQAFTTLNPNEVSEIADRPLKVCISAGSQEAFERIAGFLVPREMSEDRQVEVLEDIVPMPDDGIPAGCDIVICEQGLFRPRGSFVFYEFEPDKMVREILANHPELDLALARRFPAFRERVVNGIVGRVAKENGWFSVATAVPNVLPSPLLVPWSLGEFASDTAFLTMNQVRMLFLIAAASGREVGFREQRSQIASVIAAAFGWRSLARQAIGKVPFGGGIIPKAAIAYAGTWVLGAGFERLYRVGYGLTEAERKMMFEEAFERGKKTLSELLRISRKKAAEAERQASGNVVTITNSDLP
jgi:uncharacterized protein (DUF697 family)